MNHRATLFLLAYQLVLIHVVNAWTSTSTFSYLKTTHSKQHKHHKQTSTSSYLPSSSSSSEDYSVVLGLPPLGIVFEDISSGYPPKGVEVVALTTGGKGANCGKIEIGDQLKTCSAIKFFPGSSKYELITLDCTKLDFDTVVSAITSNDEKFGCESVEMTFIRPQAPL